MLRRALAIGLLFTVSASVTRAEMIQFTFQGEVVSVVGATGAFSSVSLGDPFSFSYIFDTHMTDLDSDPDFGFFVNALESPEVQLGSLSLSDWTNSKLSIMNNMDGDHYVASFDDGTGLSSSIELLDSTETALSSGDHPHALNMNGFDSNTGYFVITGIGEGAETGFIQAHITSMHSAVVPLPAPFWLGAAGLGMVAVARRFTR